MTECQHSHALETETVTIWEDRIPDCVKFSEFLKMPNFFFFNPVLYEGLLGVHRSYEVIFHSLYSLIL